MEGGSGFGGEETCLSRDKNSLEKSTRSTACFLVVFLPIPLAAMTSSHHPCKALLHQVHILLIKHHLIIGMQWLVLLLSKARLVLC